MAGTSAEDHPIAARIRRALTDGPAPIALEVIDESYKHAKHAHVISRTGTAGTPGETHFLIKVVSARFDGKSRLERHRMVNALVAGEMGPEKVHAMAIEAKAAAEAKVGA